MKRETRWIELSELDVNNRAAQPPNLRHRARRSRSTHVMFIGAMIAVLMVSSALGDSDTEFANANQEFAQGHFKQAISGYEALVKEGQWSANLFYDLGNAYFRTRDFGRAILNYERALALQPHHPEATANLQIARDEE